jgi:hypothetical protein
MREIDSQMLAFALGDSSEEVRAHFFRNLSKRAAGMLKEDMEYQAPYDESNIESARQRILEIYDHLRWEAENDSAFGKSIEEYAKRKPTAKRRAGVVSAQIEHTNAERPYIVMTLRGTGKIAERISVTLFDTFESAENFCDFINTLNLS